jgi:AcrR family transcriptional regulator
MSMSIPYEASGRTAQKARTRTALVEAARQLLREGPAPTVEEAARRARVARSTAYRYFPNTESLLRATFPESFTNSLLTDCNTNDPEHRLALVLDRMGEQLLTHEPELRTHLRLSLDGPRDDLPFRTGRAVGWIVEALEPLAPDMSTTAIHSLATAIRAAFGIEPLVWLTDIGGLDSPDAIAVMRASANAIYQAGVTREK